MEERLRDYLKRNKSIKLRVIEREVGIPITTLDKFVKYDATMADKWVVKTIEHIKNTLLAY